MSFRLYADMGNTTLHWALHVSDAAPCWVIATRVACGSDFVQRCGRAMDAMLGRAGAKAGDYAGGLACSSNPGANDRLAEAVGACLGGSVPMLTHELAASVRTGYHDRAQIGLDRLANAAGLRGLVALPAVVADVGSCVTVDYVDRDGVVVGGAIAPGLPLMKAGMVARTPHLRAALDSLEPPAAPTEPGRSTRECVALGLYGTLAATPAALAEGLCRGRGPASGVLTGGDGAWVQSWTGWADLVDELLTLRGLHSLDPAADN